MTALARPSKKNGRRIAAERTRFCFRRPAVPELCPTWQTLHGEQSLDGKFGWHAQRRCDSACDRCGDLPFEREQAMSRRFQFRRRALLAVMSAVAIVCAVWTNLPPQVRLTDKSAPTARKLFISVVSSLAIILGWIVYAVVARPYLEERRLIGRRVSQGRPIVQAVYEFQKANGSWPATLQELVPDFLSEPPPVEGNWSYSTAEDRPPSLSADGGPGRRLIYGFPPRKAALLPANVDHGWILDGRDGESFVAAD
jgi:hypothetical protein